MHTFGTPLFLRRYRDRLLFSLLLVITSCFFTLHIIVSPLFISVARYDVRQIDVLIPLTTCKRLKFLSPLCSLNSRCINYAAFSRSDWSHHSYNHISVSCCCHYNTTVSRLTGQTWGFLTYSLISYLLLMKWLDIIYFEVANRLFTYIKIVARSRHISVFLQYFTLSKKVVWNAWE